MAEEEVKWYQIQEKVFTRWVNDYLSERDSGLDNLRTDLKDGTKLIILLEILSGKRVGKHNRKPRMKFHKLENLALVLKFIKKQGLPLVNIGPEDIFNGNMTIILGLIWLLIMFYEIRQQESGNKSQSNMLLQWVKQQIPEYKLKNFTKNWNDGRAVCALVNSFIPGLIPDHYDKDSNKSMENATMGIELAEEYLGIDQLILPEEMTHKKVDKLAMMTYISQFRNIKEEDIKIPKGAKDCRAWGDGLDKGIASLESKFYVEIPKDVRPGNLKVQVFQCESNTAVPVKVKNNDNSGKPEEYEVTYTPTKAGKYRIQVTVDDKHIPGSSFNLDVQSGASLCKAYGPGLEDGGIVGQQLEFVVEVPDLVEDKVEVRVEGPTDDAPVVLNKNDHGGYDVQYEPKVPGKYRVHVTVGQEHIPGSIFEVEVTHPSSACKAYGPGLEKSVVGEEAPFKVEIPEWVSEDYKLNVSIQDPTGNEFPVDMSQTTGRNYDCVYSPKTPGDYLVNVKVGEVDVPGSIFKVTAATPVASQCRAYGDGLTTGVTGKPSNFVVEVPEKIRSEVDGKLAITVTGPDGPVDTKMTKNDKGDHVVDYTPTKPGAYEVSVNVGIHPIPGSVFHPNVQNLAGFCKAYGPGVEGGVAGQEAPFEIEVPAELRELVDGKVAVKVEGPNGEENVEIEKNEQGNYDAVYTPNVSGEYKVSCTVDSIHIPDSPFTVPIAHPAGFCKAHGDGLEKATTGKPSAFMVDVPEEYRSFVEGKLEVKVEGPADDATVEVTKNDSGNYDVSYLPTVPGEYKVYVSVDSEQIPGSCFLVTVDHPADYCKAYGEGLKSGTAGREANFCVDIPESLRALAEEKLGCTVEGPEGEISINTRKNDEGNYEISYLPKIPGDYTIALTLDKYHVPGSKFTPVIGEPDAMRCTAYGGGLEEGTAEVPTSFVVVMPADIPEKDLNIDIVCPDGTKNLVSVKKREEKENDKVKKGLHGKPKNKFDVKYTPKILESYPQNFLLHVKVNGYDIPGSVFEVPIEKPPVRGRVRVYFTTTSFNMMTKVNIDKLELLFYILKVYLRPDFEPWHAVDLMERPEREEVFAEAGTRELPIVFVDDVYIGNWDEIEAKNEFGELTNILALHTVKLLTQEEHAARLLGLAMAGNSMEGGHRTHFCGTCGWTKLKDNKYCPECGSNNPMPFTPEKLAKMLRFHDVKHADEPDDYIPPKRRRNRKTKEQRMKEREEEKKERVTNLRKLPDDEVNDIDFFRACYNGDLEKVEAMMVQGLDPNNIHDEYGQTPWIAALEGGQDKVGVLLIDYGLVFTQEDFFIAVNDDHLDLVEIMLEKGANPNSTDEEGTYPLMLAMENQHGLMARMLRKHGALEKPSQQKAKFLLKESKPLPPLPTGEEYEQMVCDFFGAAWEGDIETAKAFIARGMKTNLADEDGGTLLEAAQSGESDDKEKMIALLKRHGA